MKPQPFELSFEFFPPRTEKGQANLANTYHDLATYDPGFFSVTYGAGGSTQLKTYETIVNIQHNTSVNACPHLTCVGATNSEILDLVAQYKKQGIHRLAILRGDPPGGMVGMGECRYASDLVRLIRQHHGDYFNIAVAAYPEAHPDSKNLITEVDHFAEKMNAGANFAITQYFFNADSYFHFMELCENKNIRQPVIPGIMPIANFTSLKKFSRQCGAEIPRWIKKTMTAFEDDIESQRQFGLEVVTKMAQELADNGAPGLHFFTMNQSVLSRSIIQNLNLQG